MYDICIRVCVCVCVCVFVYICLLFLIQIYLHDSEYIFTYLKHSDENVTWCPTI